MFEIETRFSRRELTEWRIYARRHPFGPERDNLHAAIVAASVVNVNLGKGSRARKVTDFMPYLDQPPKAETDMQTALKSAVLGIGKRNRRPR